MPDRKDFVQIEEGAVNAGLSVYVGYSGRPNSDLSGPYRVTRRARDHAGEFIETKDGPRIRLADDEDYGYPQFYAPKPA